MDVTFFFSAKKKVTKEKTRDLVTRCNVSALAMPVVAARYAMSHFTVASGSSLGYSILYVFFLPVSKKASGERGQNNLGLCSRKGIAILA
ncbi:hypothetical protein INP83_18735 [Mucilaginibacter sp. 21P]|uniref:hypothetical protein n=1 Tax=Mucilaginibacter sp. 21P TaxID=2778902 RepID=UPI001C56BE29|nr:hypothetical protein [Mucilaginibacter sp. 21P]QXV65094.1 hypothetical protein INP83_18735 [Mucilaginibacter sp. 21P]